MWEDLLSPMMYFSNSFDLEFIHCVMNFESSLVHLSSSWLNNQINTIRTDSQLGSVRDNDKELKRTDKI